MMKDLSIYLVKKQLRRYLKLEFLFYLLIMPTLMTGMWLGQNLFAKASEAGFRRIALIFLMVIGIATLFL